MANLLDYGLQGLDWYQQNRAISESREDINKGFSQARGDIKEYQEPYQQFGLSHMGGYDALGEFSYSGEDFYRDPSYQWRMDQGMENLQRSQAANKMLASGSTLTGLTDYAQGAASQEYQAAFDRARTSYDTNRAYHQFPIGLGAETATSMGQSLADIAGARGMSNAAIEQARAQSLSGLIGGVRDTMGYGGAGGAPPPTTGGGLIDRGVDWLGGKAKDLLGLGGAGGGPLGIQTGGGLAGLGGAGASALGTGGAFGSYSGIGAEALNVPAIGGGGSTSMYGGALGISQDTLPGFGGDFSAAFGEEMASGVAAPAASGFASWAMTSLAGVGAIMGLRTLVSSLRGESPFNEAMGELKNSKDPLGDIQQLSGDQLPRSVQHTEDNFAQLNDRQARGSLYGAILNQMSPEQLQGMRYHQNINAIVGDMMAFARTGQDAGGKHSLGGSPTKALKSLFPEMSKDIDAMYGGSSQSFFMQEREMTADMDVNLDRDLFAGMRQDLIDEGDAARKRVQSYINEQLGVWRADRIEAQALEGLV